MTEQQPMIPQPDIKPQEPLKQVNYAVLTTEVSTGIYQCGILNSLNNEPLVDEKGNLWRILLSDSDAQKYLQGFANNKDLQYNVETKELSLVDRPAPPPIPLSVQAQIQFNSAIEYGSGYRWNKLTSDEQKELTSYLDILNNIIDGTDTKSTELPDKPDWVK